MDSILFLDASQHPPADAKDTRCPGLEKALEPLGFRVIGLVLAVSQEDHTPKLYADPRDQAEHEAIMKGAISATMVAEDGSAFAEPERAHHMDFLRFRSLLKSGDIVETRLRPTRQPRKRLFADPEDFPELAEDDAHEIIERIDRLLERLIGRSDEGNFPDLAAAGLHRDSVADTTPAELWKRHQERVARIAGRLRASPVEHRSLDLFLAMTRRGWHVQECYTNRHLSVTAWLSLAMTAAWFAIGPIVGWASGATAADLCFAQAAALGLCGAVEWLGNQRWLLTGSIGMLGTLAVGHFLGLSFWPVLSMTVYGFFVLFFRHVWDLVFQYRVAPPICRRVPYPTRVPADELLNVYG